MKQGFMLIELIIATLIASMVAGVLFAALFQSSRVQTSVDNVIDLSVRVGVVENQLEKDLLGVFIPQQAEEKKQEAKKPSIPEASKDKSSENQEEQKAPAKETPKPIEKIFYSTNKNGQLDALTFVTNNPLVVYVGKDVGVAKPKAVRVQYTLKPEENKKDSYALFRQESMELDLEKYKNITSYEVIGGIKRCTVTFTARIPKKDEKASSSAKATEDSANASEKVKYEYKTQNEWVSEQKKENTENKEKSEFPRIPYNMEMKLLLWDLQEKKEKEFTIVCEIPTDFSPIKKQEKKPEQPKKEENKEAEQPVDQIPFAPSFAKASAGGPNVAHNNQQTTKKIITLADQTGRVVYQAEKNENTVNEVWKRFGIRV